ncbi:MULTISPECIES: cell division protein FtsL [Bacillus]|jgi:cell division protein FtsL|uniref:cell division protein FtsL n=1 Tax=Bacillus TaxID=1386 RepID=UPI00065E25A4|nr:cell division protein FtsL [Bacillus smithii]AKP46761.1 Cell division protein FtsL [Bacillus smithii]MED4882965.1 cell division protein FtsL [Bacillus smithii]MED4926996.1 cell division protein FtsL [Bacillus smithii]
MANVARKVQVFEEPELRKPIAPKKVRRHKRWLTPGEKVMIVVFALFFCVLSVKIISTETAIYQTNKEIQQIEAKVKNQQKVNKDLQMQISEDSTYKKIWEKARQQGLNLNQQNIKVVQ